MVEFKKIQEAMEKQFKKMSKDVNVLYTLNLERHELWDIYMNSFPEGTNKIFRKRKEHDCSCCRHFINNFGDTVAIMDNKIVSIWDFEVVDEAFTTVVKKLSEYVHTKTVQDVYVSKDKQIGTQQNLEDNEGTIITWEHFNINLPSKFVSNSSDSISKIQGKYRDVKNVFTRSLTELSQESVLTVLELIAQKSLYKGEEWKTILTNFNKYQKEYEAVSEFDSDNYLWVTSTMVGPVIGKIRNHSIGQLLIDISAGVDLDVAVKKYEAIVAPTSYKRPKPIYTKKMLEEAKQKLEDLGYMDSLQRRYAILEDISINNVLFANKDDVKRMQSDDVFGDMEKGISVNPKAFNKVEEVDVETFVKDILPTTKSIELYFEGKHKPNMVSLIAPFKANSKSMFKWDNNFSWAYTGNITDSDIRKNVKSAGGKIDGVLRFSIQWNDGNENNSDDYDAHCIEPQGNEIYYGRKSNDMTTGILDVDIIYPRIGKAAVENITWSRQDRMQHGTYKFFVHDYSHRGGSDGFRAEVEFNGQMYEFNYPKGLRQGERVQVAEVTFDGENFAIKEKLPSSVSSLEVWNLKSNNFIPVSTLMMSPNYWDGQKGVGNKHYFFMLKDCVNDESPNGFFNEFLHNDLIEHKKVFEALGTRMKVGQIDNQLSGLGFSSTQNNSVIIKIEGQTKRIMKVKI